MADINHEGEHDEKKMVENQVHKQPEKRDMMNDINPKGKDDEEEVGGKQLVATEDTPRLRKEESMTKDWKMKAEIRFVQSDVLDDTKKKKMMTLKKKQKPK
jgi:hypothetical protein